MIASVQAQSPHSDLFSDTRTCEYSSESADHKATTHSSLAVECQFLYHIVAKASVFADSPLLILPDTIKPWTSSQVYARLD